MKKVSRWLRTAAALAVVSFASCSEPPAKNGGNVDCEGSAPGCGQCQAPICEDGAWSCVGTPCANGQTTCESDPPDCGRCSQESCVDGSWVCLDTPCPPPNNTNNLGACEMQPEPACDCPEGPSCIEDQWVCDCPVQLECFGQGESSLPGVAIEFPATRCNWTLEEVAAGIEIPYIVQVDQDHFVDPLSQQNGCDAPGESGLAPFERITGMDQNYCICDVGLCPNEDQAVEVFAGSYEFAMQWDGVNWEGPSDTGNPKGEPFPPGIYTVEIRAVGFDFETELEYEVVGTMDIQLLE